MFTKEYSKIRIYLINAALVRVNYTKINANNKLQEHNA